MSKINFKDAHVYEAGLGYIRINIVYSRLELTKQSDILPALSKFGKPFLQVMNGRYPAGIWSTDLVRAQSGRKAPNFHLRIASVLNNLSKLHQVLGFYSLTASIGEVVNLLTKPLYRVLFKVPISVV